jgi:hypothetical protein
MSHCKVEKKPQEHAYVACEQQHQGAKTIWNTTKEDEPI